MSMKITEIEGPNGQKIYIQYDEDDNDDLQAVGSVDDIAERTRKYQEVLKSTIRGYSQMVMDSVKTAIPEGSPPSKVTLQFGIQAGGETGIPFVTKGTAQANITVTVEWELNKNQQA
jgi:hypothetical protein